MEWKRKRKQSGNLLTRESKKKQIEKEMVRYGPDFMGNLDVNWTWEVMILPFHLGKKF